MDLKAYVTFYSPKTGIVERRKESRGPESNLESLGSQMLQGTVFKNKVGRMYAKA
jgi:hypothetical protein